MTKLMLTKALRKRKQNLKSLDYCSHYWSKKIIANILTPNLYFIKKFKLNTYSGFFLKLPLILRTKQQLTIQKIQTISKTGKTCTQNQTNNRHAGTEFKVPRIPKFCDGWQRQRYASLLYWNERPDGKH